MGRQRRTQILRGLALLFALSVLGVVLARLAGWNPDIEPSPPSHLSSTVLGTNTPSQSDGSVITSTEPPPTDLLFRETPTPGPTLIGSPTPADAWANSLLDKVLTRLQHPQEISDGFAWWQRSEASGKLGISDAILTLNLQPVDLSKQVSIDISVVRQENPNQLEHIAYVAVEQGALALTVFSLQPNVENEHWVLSNVEPSTALEALVIQAAARSAILRAAYVENPARAAEFVLIEATGIFTPTASSTGMMTDVTPSATYVPTSTFPAATATPTRVPDIYLGRVITAAIDPVIDNAVLFLPTVVQDFANRHPRTGYLEWSKTGPQLSGQPLSVSQATDLTLYTLSPSEPEGTVTGFLKIIYINNTTRLPEKQIYFPGQRMEEILLWLVTRADERDGRLHIAYDDFGTKQAITIIGFDSND